MIKDSQKELKLVLKDLIWGNLAIPQYSEKIHQKKDKKRQEDVYFIEFFK